MLADRELLESYVLTGKLMQLASLSPDGFPAMCNVWYDAHFRPDLVRFISREDRRHSENIRRAPQVAGSIIAVTLEGLGQKAQGVTFTGLARELPAAGSDSEIEDFLKRWPAAASAINPTKAAPYRPTSRLYEIAVSEWVLFDEEHFSHQPRRVIEAWASSQSPRCNRRLNSPAE